MNSIYLLNQAIIEFCLLKDNVLAFVFPVLKSLFPYNALQEMQITLLLNTRCIIMYDMVECLILAHLMFFNQKKNLNFF